MSLLQLPLEVRSQIFSYVLTSPSGSIWLCDLQLAEARLRSWSWTANSRPETMKPKGLFILSRDGSNRPFRISLAFLRTCKTIYEEFKDLKPFWKNNAFQLTASMNDMTKFPAALASQIQNVEMEFDMCPSQDKFSKQEQELATLRIWKSLKYISLSLCPHNQNIAGFWRDFEQCKNCWRWSSAPHFKYVKTLRCLKEAGGTNGYFSHLERQICIPQRERNFGVEVASPRVSFNAEDGDPNKTFEDWATAFGGRLLVDGMVCYENGALVRSAFVSDPDEKDVECENSTEANYTLRTDAYISRLAIFFTEAKGGNLSKGVGKEAQRIYKTYSFELLDHICHDWGLSSSWTVEERMKLVEERTREFRRNN